jgi:hypothetical protein
MSRKSLAGVVYMREMHHRQREWLHPDLRDHLLAAVILII